MKKTDRPFDWVNIAFLTLSPVLAVGWGLYYTRRYGFQTPLFVLFIAMFFATGLSITGGYHRYFAHASYKAHPLVRLLLRPPKVKAAS